MLSVFRSDDEELDREGGLSPYYLDEVWERGDLAPIFISILCMDKRKTSCEYHLLLKCQNILCPGKLSNRPVN